MSPVKFNVFGPFINSIPTLPEPGDIFPIRSNVLLVCTAPIVQGSIFSPGVFTSKHSTAYVCVLKKGALNKRAGYCI